METVLIKGMTYGWGAKRGDYRKPSAIASLEKLRETGSEWIALSFWTWQTSPHATDIAFDYGYTVTDRDIALAVQAAKQLGMKVCLKPVVNSRDGIWRAHIGFPEEAGAEPYWEQWFSSYRQFLLHYAELAEELGCEMFCVGCEMVKTEARETQWREVIAAVRDVYHGPLIYNANHGSEEGVQWFDAVDLIGTSAYYPVAKEAGASEESMRQSWEQVKGRFVRLHERFRKPIVFMEIGCRSASGCAAMPWDFMHRELPYDEEEQARFYSSAFTAFWHEPWFGGFFWWDWSTHLYPIEEAGQQRGFDIYGKRAEQIVKLWYKGER